MLNDLTLTVTPTGRVYPSRALCQALALRGGQLVDIVPPRAKGGGTWHLDARANGPTATLTASNTRRPEFRTAYQLKPSHFRLPAVVGQPHLRFDKLVLVVDIEVEPRYYRLKRAA